jgi:Ca2+-binding RTX toxin-like protein
MTTQNWTYRVFVDTSFNPSQAELGHAYIQITSPFGDSTTVGYYPNTSLPGTVGMPGSSGGHVLSGPGIVRNDSLTGRNPDGSPTQHRYDFVTLPREISADTAQKMLNYISFVSTSPGEYGVFGNNCVQFVEDLMKIAGDRTSLDDTVAPMVLAGQLSFFEKAREFLRDHINLDDLTNTLFNAARNWTAPRDPLVLDLDGDGIETVGINPAAPIVFDHDGDGIRNGTGWIKADDGLLVLDLDGNGSIDSGRELFGDNTYVAGTPYRLAIHGYDALRQYDLNWDQQINSQDTVFSQLRIWQDANQDGISQSTELKSLQTLGISSIGLANNFGSASTDLGNGNLQIASGTYTRADGSSGVSGVAQLSGSLLLAGNNFYRSFMDNPTITPAAAALPQMQGSGLVRDLREAMSLGTAQATLLQQKVQAYAAAATRDEQMAVLPELVGAWAETTGKVMGSHRGYVLTAIVNAGSMIKELGYLEVFNGDDILNLGFTSRIEGASLVADNRIMSPAQIELLGSSWLALTDSVHKSLALQTRLKPHLDSINLVIDDLGISFDATPMMAKLDAAYATHAKNGLADMAELLRYSGGILEAVGVRDAALDKLKVWVQAYAATGGTEALAWLTDLKVQLAGAGKADLVGSVIDDVLFGDAAANSLTGSGGDDVLFGEGSNDTLSGGAGNDTLNAGADNDRVYGNEGDDKLNGEDGNDWLEGGAGNDTFNGGAGNDDHAGGNYSIYTGYTEGLGNDTYLFGRGDGIDRVFDRDTTTSNKDIIRFKAGVASADVQISRDGNNLILKINGTTDQITALNYFGGDATDGWQIEEIRFTDESTVVWNVATIKSKVLNGGTGDDNLVGYASADTMNGGAGADTISGLAGNDTLNGEDGNDTLQGNAGNDTFNGGTGNDSLFGGALNPYTGVHQGDGNDNYLFGRGNGQDTIFDYDATADNQDKLSFLAGIAKNQLWLSKVGNNLEISIIGTTDKVSVSNWYSGSAYQIEQFTTASGNVLTSAKVDAMVSGMAAIPVVLTGQVTVAPEHQAALDALVNSHWV